MTDREALREAVARAIHERRLRSSSDDIADAVLALIIPACQEAVRARGPVTQDMRSTDICDALDGAADAIAAFLPGGRADVR